MRFAVQYEALWRWHSQLNVICNKGSRHAQTLLNASRAVFFALTLAPALYAGERCHAKHGDDARLIMGVY